MDDKQIEWIEDLKTINLMPGDVMVLRVAHKLSIMEEDQVKAVLFRIFPHHKLLILYPGVEFGVVSGEVRVEGSQDA